MGRVFRVTEEDDNDGGFIGGIIVIGLIIFVVGWIIKILAYVLPVAIVVGLIIWIVRTKNRAGENKRYRETTSIEDAFDKLTTYHDLLRSGAITQIEYNKQKEQLLAFITNYMEKAIRKKDRNAKEDALNKLSLWHSLLVNKTITQSEYEIQKNLCLTLINE